MPTFLVTSKMHPALAERVRASLTPRDRRGKRSSSAARLTALVRVALLVAVVVLAVVVYRTHRMRVDHLEQTRAELLDALETEAAALAPRDLKLVQRVQPWLATAALKYEGDTTSDDLRSAVGLDALLKRPTVYVRGTQQGFSDSERLVEAAAESGKDSFVLCLLDPPDERAESALIEKVYAAQRGSGVAEEHTANVRRLYDAIVGLRLLAPEWVTKVRETDDVVHLLGLKDLFEKSPITRATQAAKSEILLYLVDEPRESGITELDGANIHHVRIGIVDLSEERVVLRMRRRVDPTWVSLKRRSRYARELNACALAMDVRRELLER